MLGLGVLAMWLGCSLLGHGMEVALDRGHYDVAFRYHGETGWEAYLKGYGEPERSLQSTLLVARAGTAWTVPDGPGYGFLGDPGTEVWVLPEQLRPPRTVGTDLWLGIGTQEVPPGLFTGGTGSTGRIQLRLVAVEGSGPERGGAFVMWQEDFHPRVHFSSRDGIDERDTLGNIPAGAHAHYNWTLTAPGFYRVTLEISGTLAAAHGGRLVQGRFPLHLGVPDSGSGWAGGVERGDGWRLSPWFGLYTEVGRWTFHAQIGWLFASATGPDSSWAFDLDLGWLHFDRAAMPFVFQHEPSRWLVFLGGQTDNRWFFDLHGHWVSDPGPP